MEFEEFKKTIYYTEMKIVIPLFDIRLDKVDFMKNGKMLFDKIDNKLYDIYETNYKNKINENS